MAAEGYTSESYLDIDDHSPPPEDKWKVCYILLFFMGMASLVPWNMYITASSYFQNRLCYEKDGKMIQGTSANYWPYCVTFSICVCNIIGSLLAVAYQTKIRQRIRILVPLIVNTVVFVLCSVLVFVDIPTDLFFVLSLTSGMLTGIFGSFLQGGMFGLAGDLPPIYTQALMGGQGLAGFAVAVNGLVAALATAGDHDNQTDCKNQDDFKTPTLGYFLVAVFILLFCVVGYLVLERLPFVHHYQAEKARLSSRQNTPQAGCSQQSDRVVVNDEDHLAPLLPQEKSMISWSDSTILFRKIRFHAASVFMMFMVTLSVFPAVTQNLESEEAVAALKTHDHVPTFLTTQVFSAVSFVNFNFFDLMGRLCAGFVPIEKGTGPCFLVLSLLRWAFVLLFLSCQIHKGNNVFPATLTSDVAPIAIMTMFALTNGLITSLAMMRAPRLVADLETSTSGTMMSFCMMGGLLAGTIVSFGIKEL
mmetsp:Transcript_29860/g.58510  ORF Transcript_29860/g.58510 Transcript_29860/m.58510 type:complete len:475 (+) Transcript_29860:63-1487(+)|eukprot:CAMPEP_0175139020 /NCGR_PEP_ID=MMETSP0087-20121206/10667_1 /TAXON_ID=136419 /ORGANISM="Unknown Unknown, Strain D1" /LENGTH=474 /DNA_ID=CAMNT_0016421977 /DNA_START=58 /DNA_END=1482 /DNA_ORIENTATION=-